MTARERQPLLAAHRSFLLMVLVLALMSAFGAILAARITLGLDGWLWNLDLPKIHYPLAVFYHEALAAGRLPLWEDSMGLGFPLYAEGQVGAFYPPHWLVFQLEPLVALDVVRLLHLTFAGVGAGLVGLRVSGSRHGAVVTAVVATMAGAIVTKFEWWNVVVAYAWVPWVLLPLAGRSPPRRAEVVAAGILWGIQALTGHPNTWLLTGAAAVVLLLRPPWLTSIGRTVAFGIIGAGVGALQLIPTYMLLGISARSEGLSDVFVNTATPFDLVAAGFVNLFIRASAREWEYGTSWFPDGYFPVLEAGIYVGLPALALAGLAIPARRSRRWLVLIGVMAALAIIPAFKPDFWTEIPLVGTLRAPVRSYIILSLGVAVLAAIGVSRLGRTRAGIPWGLGVLALPIVGYMLVTAAAFYAPSVFQAILAVSVTHVSQEGLDASLELARLALVSPWPFLAELGIALAMGFLIIRPRTIWAVTGAVILSVLPLMLFVPLINPVRGPESFTAAGSPIATALLEQDAHRVLSLDRPPPAYEGSANRLAAVGVPDIIMYSSLNLDHVDTAVQHLLRGDPEGIARRAIGVDVLVTYGEVCSGRLVDRVPEDEAYICRIPRAVTPPYWLPRDAAQPVVADIEGPPSAYLDAAGAVAGAVPLAPGHASTTLRTWVLEAPEPGWVLIDLAWWPGWEVTVDGSPVPALEALGGQLVAVPAGRHDVVATLTLREVGGGALLGILVLAAAGAWLAWPRLRRRTSRHSGSSGE